MKYYIGAASTYAKEVIIIFIQHDIKIDPL